MSDEEWNDSDIGDDGDFDENENVNEEDEEEEKEENSEYEEFKNDQKDDASDNSDEEDDIDADIVADDDINNFNVNDCIYKNAKTKKKSLIIEDKSLNPSKNKLFGMIIVKNEDRITGNRLTDYEITRIMGTRMRQFQLGAPALIEIPNEIDLENLAKLELIEKKTPYIVCRPIPNNYIEIWYIHEMFVPETLWG